MSYSADIGSDIYYGARSKLKREGIKGAASLGGDCDTLICIAGSMAEAMIDRNENYNRTLDLIKELERSGELFVIRPEKAPGVKHMEHDPDKLSDLYLKGRRAAERSLEDIREFIE